jgi:hypothetical protein
MVIYDSVLFAVVALLCVRDDSVGQRSSRNRGPDYHRRMTVVATAVLTGAVLVPIAVFSLLRIAGDPKPAYDVALSAREGLRPVRRLERAGKPGPFYR